MGEEKHEAEDTDYVNPWELFYDSISWLHFYGSPPRMPLSCPLLSGTFLHFKCQLILKSPCSNSSAVAGTYSSLTPCPNHSHNLCVFLITAHQLQLWLWEESAINYMLGPNASRVNRSQIGLIIQSVTARKSQFTSGGLD